MHACSVSLNVWSPKFRARIIRLPMSNTSADPETPPVHRPRWCPLACYKAFTITASSSTTTKPNTPQAYSISYQAIRTEAMAAFKSSELRMTLLCLALVGLLLLSHNAAPVAAEGAGEGMNSFSFNSAGGRTLSSFSMNRASGDGETDHDARAGERV
jgi:hypothetical protein